VEQSFKDIEIVYEYNTRSMLSVLEFARSNNSKIIYSGSSTKFSDLDVGFAQSPYSFTKAMNTELIKNYGS
jgi:UDP-glucose 4-epimerase